MLYRHVLHVHFDEVEDSGPCPTRMLVTLIYRFLKDIAIFVSYLTLKSNSDQWSLITTMEYHPTVTTECFKSSYVNRLIFRYELLQLITATKFCCSDNYFVHKLNLSHKEDCCGDLFPQLVAATYRLVCPGP